LKNVLFIATHLHSGHDILTNSLNQNERIDLKNQRLMYEHPEVLNHLFSFKHKNPNSASIYGDLLLNNKDFTCKSFYKFAKFIFLIRKPEETLPLILINDKNYTQETAYMYYSFRLRRLYEMAFEIKNFIFLKYDDLILNKKNNIKEYLKLNEEIEFTFNSDQITPFVNVNPLIINKANKCYEKYLYKINQLSL
jgi:hypothetical protein